MMALDQSIVYATYEDDGMDSPGGQLMSQTSGQKRLLIFPNMPLAKDYEQALRQWGNGCKNPRLTAFYSQDSDEILVSCFPAKVIELATPPPERE